MTIIQPTASFKDNLRLLPSIEGLARIELIDASGAVIATIENQPGTQGSLAVYQYLSKTFETIGPEAARHGIEIFAEHSADAQLRPGAHPNVDRLFGINTGSAPLSLRLIIA